MAEAGLKCTIAQCKARLVEINTMGLGDLEKYANTCSTCGNWILKDNKIAQETYQKVSLKWAEEFNKLNLKR